jgi:hydrogenase/urease accessory protein HupE
MITVVVSLAPAMAAAHPGPHVADPALFLRHAFTEPDHLVTMAFGAVWAAMIVAVGYWFRPWRPDSWR